MFTTPTSTPTRNKLPVIVDIGIDTEGKQQYQVHESLRLVRKEMPRSSGFVNADKTPVRNALGQFSPPNSRKKIKLEPDVALRSEGVAGLPVAGDDSDSIWPDDLEKAFEEVLGIIPKNGLNKIKISGRACGRNELISDYIYTKTGRMRTRKQVSSHIQVIKNLGQKPEIIALINEGPQFETEEERRQHAKRFEELFTKINLDKSLGLRLVPRAQEAISGVAAPAPSQPGLDLTLGPAPAHFNRTPVANPLGSVSASSIGAPSVENFFMSVYDSLSTCPVILSLQPAAQETKSVLLLPGTSIARFPCLAYFGGSRTPVVHNMVRINFPQLAANYSFESGLRTNFCVAVKEETIRNYANYTCIYSFGTPIVRFVDPIFDLNDNKPFLIKFWKVLLPRLALDLAELVASLLRGLTVEQIIYHTNHTQTPTAIPRNAVRAVLLWEFARVDDLKDAVTATLRLCMEEAPVEPQTVQMQPPLQQMLHALYTLQSLHYPQPFLSLSSAPWLEDLPYTCGDDMYVPFPDRM